MTGPAIVARRIGNERTPVTIVDGFHPDPDTIRQAAIDSLFYTAGHHYPGLRAPLPAGYMSAVQPIVAKILREVFGFGTSADLLDASFSIVTKPPALLSVQQRLPHVDAVTPGRIAMVHYLSPGRGDGTAFFRHRATGFETISAHRSARYLDRLNAELKTHGSPPATYIGNGAPLFDRTALIDAPYNRAVFYPSALLHSGAIGPATRLSEDPAQARLTVTAFLDAA